MEFGFEKLLLALAALVYCSGVFLSLYRFRLKRPPLSQINFLIVFVGLCLQSAGLYLRGLDAGGCPIRGPFEILQFISWSIIVLYVITGPVFRLSFFGSASATIAAILSGIAFLKSSWDIPARSNIFGDNPWIESHAALSLFSYGIFGILAAICSLYLLQNFSLKQKRFPSFFNNLPSLYQMDQVIFRLLVSACIVFTTAIMIGLVHWINYIHEVSKLKLFLSHSLWLAYVLTLVLYLTKKLKASRLAGTCIGLFIIALLILWPIEISQSYHSDPSPLHSQEP